MIRFMGLLVGTTLVNIALTPAQTASVATSGPSYDPAKEATFNGTVEAVIQPAQGIMRALVTVNPGMEIRIVLGPSIEVVLGPSDFVAGMGFSFGKGDAVEVSGAPVTACGAEYFIAREVVTDGKTLTLRDKNGTPAWIRMGRGVERNGSR